MDIEVKNLPLSLGPFSVIGFSITGKVVNSRNEGIQGAKVLIDGQVRAVTNENGVYRLDEITPGSYILEGSSEHYFFVFLNINILA